MTDMMQKLRGYAGQGADLSPGDAVDAWAVQEIERLRALLNPGEKVCERNGWTWFESAAYPGLHELRDRGDRLLAWINKRPSYCDRGHYEMNVEACRDIDSQDRFPRYFMRLTTAKNEAAEFLAWRLYHERVTEN